MYRATSAEIRDMTLELMKDAFYDSRGLIVCPTASPYTPQIDGQALKNYETLIETVLNYKII